MVEFSAVFLWNSTLSVMFWYKVTLNPDTGNAESKHCNVLFWKNAHIKGRKGCNTDALCECFELDSRNHYCSTQQSLDRTKFKGMQNLIHDDIL